MTPGRALLDVNVLLALLDTDHVDHARARGWLEDEIGSGWASCPITQNGFVRIVSQPSYPGGSSVTAAVDALDRATRTAHHEFWSCDVSLLDEDTVDRRRLHGSRQVTDTYLLAVAVARGGRLVTLDRAIAPTTVRGALEHHLVVL